MLLLGLLENGHPDIGGTASDYAIFKFSPDGKQLSYLGYDSGFRRGDSLADAAVGPDGTLVCVSQTETQLHRLTIHAAKFHP
jgi:hypothetical protein